MGECHHWYVPVKHIMGEWKYEVYVVLSITGTYLTGHVSNQIISGIEASIPGALAQIKEAFRVKGKDFATAVQTVEVDKGFLSSDATVVICVTLNRKGFLEARAGKRFGNVIGVAVPIDKILKEEVEKAYKAKDEAGLFMKVRTVKVKITKEGAW